MKNKNKKLTLLKSKISSLNNSQLVQGGSKDTDTTGNTINPTTPSVICVDDSNRFIPNNSVAKRG